MENSQALAEQSPAPVPDTHDFGTQSFHWLYDQAQRNIRGFEQLVKKDDEPPFYALKFQNDREAYTDGKGEFIRAALAAATRQARE